MEKNSKSNYEIYYYTPNHSVNNNEMSDAKTFATSPYHDAVLKVREFMFSDIEKTLLLDSIPKVGAPSFLLALGLCCYTEYWGNLSEGIKKDDRNKNKESFNAFLRRLDPKYYGRLLDNQVNFYREVRCGLAHAYLIEAKGDAVINAGYAGLHGIEYHKESERYTFWIRTYFDEFKNAVNHYINGLDEGTENLQKLEDSLHGRPELI